MENYNLEWKCLHHPTIDGRYIDLLFISFIDDPDPYTAGSIIEDPINNEYIWVLKGGFPYGSAKMKEDAMKDCETCLIKNYLEKGLMPWKAAFVSKN